MMAFECPDRRRPRPAFETDRREDDGPAVMFVVVVVIVEAELG